MPTETGLGITVEDAAIKKWLVPYATVAYRMLRIDLKEILEFTANSALK